MDLIVLVVVLGLIVSAMGCGIAGLVYNDDDHVSSAFVNLLVGLATGLFGLGTIIPVVYCKMHGEVLVVPLAFLVVGVAFLLTAGVQKLRNARQCA